MCYPLFSNMLEIAQQPLWVFKMVDTSLQPARVYLEIVHRRDRITLTDARNRKLSRKSVIHSDEWRVYYNLPQFVPACI